MSIWSFSPFSFQGHLYHKLNERELIIYVLVPLVFRVIYITFLKDTDEYMEFQSLQFLGSSISLINTNLQQPISFSPFSFQGHLYLLLAELESEMEVLVPLVFRVIYIIYLTKDTLFLMFQSLQFLGSSISQDMIMTETIYSFSPFSFQGHLYQNMQKNIQKSIVLVPLVFRVIYIMYI